MSARFIKQRQPEEPEKPENHCFQTPFYFLASASLF
jgi:hypothetical protein